MHVELINTGSELMQGFILNSHQQWLCRQLSILGYVVARQTAIPDTAQAIDMAVRESLQRSDLLIITGGLGPTSDDVTREHIAALLKRPLHEHPPSLQRIQDFFTARGRPMPPRTRVQAQVPAGATVISNEQGTAPGLLIEVPAGLFRPQPSLLIMLPGPTRELRPMFSRQIVPLLHQLAPPQEPQICRTYKTIGLGESYLEDKLAPALQAQVEAGLSIAYCARHGQVDVRLAAAGPAAAETLDQAEEQLLKTLAHHVYGTDEEELEHLILSCLTTRAQTLALAESCTGGLLAHRLTSVPGASAVLLAGWVTYSNDAKARCLAVSKSTLAEHGAVSEPVARQMAEGARSESGATYAIAITGIAGPTGGTLEKPAGTVYVALATADGTQVQRLLNPYDRETFKQVTTQQSLFMLHSLLRKGVRRNSSGPVR